MTFSMYQSIRNVPKDLEEASQSFHLSGWQRFWRLDVPFAMPGLIWNTMMSMSGGWFFVVASEAITVGNTTVTLPGIGSYVALGIEKQNLPAIGYAILTMLLVIIAYDQLLFRPVVAWADKFRFEQTASGDRADVLDARSVPPHPRAARADLSVRGREQGGLEPACRAAEARCGCRTNDGPPSRLVDAIWLALILGMHRLRRLAGLCNICRRRWARSDVLTRRRIRAHHAVARHRADRAGDADLGAGRGLDRAAAEARRAHPAARAVSGGLSRQPRLPGVRGDHRALRPEREHLAQPADDPRHPVVHPVQRDRGRQRLSDRPARGRRQLSPQGMALVDQGDPARHFPVLHHRRHHRVGRIVERLDRRRSRELGRHPPDGRRVSAPILPGRRKPATSRGSCSASP